MKKIVERSIKSGSVVEKTYVVVSDKKVKRKPRVMGASDARKIQANFNTTQKRLARQINCNFRRGDAFVTLNYADEHLKDYDGARHDRDLFLARLRRKLGRPLKYIAVVGEVDSATGLPERLHHHLILPKVDYGFLTAEWKCGGVDYQYLSTWPDYSELAAYLLRNVRHDRPQAQKYKSSRNMDKPVIEDRPVKNLKPLAAPRGAKVQHRGEYVPEKARDYIRYVEEVKAFEK